MKTAGPLLACTLAASCAATENFMPAERATAISPQGYTAADYEMVVEGERIGDAMVWSNGAYRSDLDGNRTVVHVGFRVENDTDVPIEIDPEDVEIHVETDGRIIRRSKPDIVEGSRVIESGRDGTLALYFVMPSGVYPQEVDAFRVNWAARAEDLAYTQRTPFLEHEIQTAYAPYPYVSSFYYSPFYDPFFHSRFLHSGLIVRPVPYRHYYFHSARR